MTTPRAHPAVPALALLALLAACTGRQAPARADFAAAVVDDLAQRGYLCLAKYDWPIAVTDADRQAGSLDARQLPVLEALGLAAGRAATVTRPAAGGGTATLPAREYALTAEGRKYYLHVPVVVATPASRVTHAADLCVARLSLDRVFGWEPPRTIDGRTVSSVLFSYRIAPAPWTSAPAARRAFPLVARAIDNAGTLQLRLGVHLAPQGWVADELTEPAADPDISAARRAAFHLPDDRTRP
jgi:hypothetical protein